MFFLFCCTCGSDSYYFIIFYFNYSLASKCGWKFSCLAVACFWFTVFRDSVCVLAFDPAYGVSRGFGTPLCI